MEHILGVMWSFCNIFRHRAYLSHTTFSMKATGRLFTAAETSNHLLCPGSTARKGKSYTNFTSCRYRHNRGHSVFTSYVQTVLLLQAYKLEMHWSSWTHSYTVRSDSSPASYQPFLQHVSDVVHRVREKKRPPCFRHNFDKFRHTFLIFSTNHPNISAY